MDVDADLDPGPESLDPMWDQLEAPMDYEVDNSILEQSLDDTLSPTAEGREHLPATAPVWHVRKTDTAIGTIIIFPHMLSRGTPQCPIGGRGLNHLGTFIMLMPRLPRSSGSRLSAWTSQLPRGRNTLPWNPMMTRIFLRRHCTSQPVHDML